MQRLVLTCTAICGITLGIFAAHASIIYVKKQIPAVPAVSDNPIAAEIPGTITSVDTVQKTISVRLKSLYTKSDFPAVIAYGDSTTLKTADGAAETMATDGAAIQQLNAGTRVFLFISRDPGSLRADRIVISAYL